MAAKAKRSTSGLRVLRLSFLAVLLPALVLLVAITIRWAATLESVHDFVVTQVEKQTFSGQRIALDSLRGDLFKRITFEKLTITDAEGEWLEVHDAEVAWNPWDLLRGNLSIDLIQAQRIHVERAPLITPSPEESKETSSNGMALNGISLKKLALPIVSLGPTLSAGSEEYAVAGSATVIENVVEAALNLNPIGSEGDTARVVAKWSPDTGLNGDVMASGQANGMLAKLLRLSPGKKPELVATASDHAGVSRVDLTLHVDSAEALSLTATRDTQNLSATGVLDMSHFEILSPAVERVGAMVRFSARSEPTDRLNIDLKTKNVDGNFTLPFDVAQLKPDLDNIAVKVSTDHASSVIGVDGLAIEQAMLQGDLVRSKNTIAFTGSARATGVETSAISAAHIGGPVEIRYSPEQQNVEATVKIAAQSFVPQQQQLAKFTGDSVELIFDGAYNIASQKLTSEKGVLSFGDQRITFKGVLDPKGEESAASGIYRLTPGSVYPDVEISELSGEWRVDGFDDGGLRARVDGTVSGISQPAEMLTWHLELPIRYEGEVDVIIADERLELRSFSLTNDRFRVAATGSRNKDQLQARLSAETGQIKNDDYMLSETALDVEVNGTLSQATYSINSAVSQLVTANEQFENIKLTASGSVQNLLEESRTHSANFNATMRSAKTNVANVDELVVSGDVSGPLASPRLNIKATTPQIATQSETISDIDFNFNGTVAAGEMTSTVSTRASWRDEPVSVDGAIAVTGSNWRVNELEADWGGIFVDGSLSGQGGALDTVRGAVNIKTEPGSSTLPLGVNGTVKLDNETFTGDFVGAEFAHGDVVLNATQLRFSGTPALVDVRLSTTGTLNMSGKPRPAVVDVTSQIKPAEKSTQSMVKLSIAGLEIKSVSPLSVRSDDDVLIASGALGVSGGIVEFSGNGTTERGEFSLNWTEVSASGLAALLGVPDIQGISKGKFEVRSDDGALAQAEYTIDATLDQLATANEQIDSVALDASGSLRNLHNDSRSHRATFNASVANARTPAVSLAKFVLSGDVSGPLTSPRLKISATTPRLATQNETIDDLQVNLDSRVAAGDIASTFSTRASWRGAPVSVDGGVALNGSKWRLDDLDVDWGGLIVDGSLSGQGAALDSMRGALDIKTEPGSSNLLPLAVNGSIKIDSDTFTGDFVAGEFAQGAVTLNTTRLSFSGTPRLVDVKVTTTGAIEVSGEPQATVINISSQIASEEKSSRSMVDMTIADLEIKSLAPLSIQSKDDVLIASGALGISGGTVEFTADGTTDKGNLNFEWTDVSAAGLARLLNRPELRGVSDGKFELRSDGGPATGSGSASLKKLTVKGTRELPTELVVEASLDGTALKTRLTGNGADINLDGEITLPMLNPGGLGALGLDRAAPVNGKATGRGKVDTLWAVFGPVDSKFVGQFDFDANLTGSIDEPVPRGVFRMDAAEFEDGVSGFHVKDITVNAEVDDQEIRVNRLQMKGVSGGSVEGAGTVSLDGSSAVTLRLNQISPFQRADFAATASGDIRINQSVKGIEIAGEIDIDQAKVDLDHLPAGGFATLDVTFKESRDTRKSTSPDNATSAIDVKLNAANRILIVGKGIDSEWRTNLSITGPISSPELKGDVQLVRGTAELIGRRLTFVDSSVRFNGDLEAGRLSIRAERPVDDLTAAVEINGTVSTPSIKFTSTPTQPEDEVLSRLLFGTSAAQLSGLQAAQLAIAISSLSGGKSFDFAGPLKRALGVERLNVGVSDDGSASVSAGKYLRDDVYVEASTGASGEPGVHVEWTPRRNIEIGGKIESEKGPTLSLKWKHDYDPDRSESKPDGKP